MSFDSNRFSALIADNEQHSRDKLLQILDNLKTQIPLTSIHQVSDGLSAFDFLSQYNDRSTPLIAFLNKDLPQMSGLELAHHIAKMRKPPSIILLTSQDEPSISVFEENSTECLTKPLNKENLANIFTKILNLGTSTEKISDQHLNAAGLKRRTHLSVSERGRVKLIPVSEILFLKAELKYTTIKTAEKEFLTEEPLIGLEQEFSEHFIRIHRNCLIPKTKIKNFERNKSEESGWVAIIDGVSEKLSVSRRQWAQIRELKPSLIQNNQN